MRTPALLLTVLAATLLIAPASSQDEPNRSREEQIQEPRKTVKELQKERLAVLKTLTDQLTRLFQDGSVEFDELLEAKVQLLQAELDAAETQQDRLMLYEHLVEELKKSEQFARARMEAAQAPMTAVLKAKAKRLEAEILLEQVQAEPLDVKHQKPVVTNPQVKNATITEQYVCQINAQRHIDLRALQTGSIEAISVKEGQAVKAGDLVFKILPSLYKARLDAELAELRIAELEFQNVENLFQKKVVAEIEMKLAKSKLERAKARMELAKAELNFTEVRAPFDGIIGRLGAQPGSMIKEGETLTTLADNSSMWVYFNVPEARYLEHVAVENNNESSIELVLANGRKFDQSGKINAIEADFDHASGTIAFRADFPNPDRVLRHGMTGTVLVRRTLNDAVVIPQRATFEEGDKRYVYVVDQNEVAHRREIVVQNELEDLYVIDSGVDASDRMIVEGIRGVHEGEKVKYDFRPSDQASELQKEHAE